MSTTYEKCTHEAHPDVLSIANQVLCAYECHKPLLDAKVRIDYVFASAECNEKTGAPMDDPLKLHGYPCFAIARKISLKDRAKGMGDAEICIDRHQWEAANELEQSALLDHELSHLQVVFDKRGLVRDDLGRPKLKLRLHDVQAGWFADVALRHGNASQEIKQARAYFDAYGQAIWPDLIPKVGVE